MSLDSERLKQRIRADAAEIVRLKSRIDEAVTDRTKNRKKRSDWEQTCAEFHARYNGFAFPGGYDGARKRISSGDPEATEATICFLECRPYSFCSGHMFKDVLRWC